MIALQIALLLAAVVMVVRAKTLTAGQKVVWIVVSVLIPVVGPVAALLFLAFRPKKDGALRPTPRVESAPGASR